MSLVHPSLTTTGKRRGKIKFKNAAEAQRARQLETDWADLQKKWGVQTGPVRPSKSMPATALEYKLTAPVGRETRRIPSLDTGHVGATSSKQIPRYTGDKIVGIGQMAKSNAVPVFSKEEAIDIARMRRG
jgi:hypothetical protein